MQKIISVDEFNQKNKNLVFKEGSKQVLVLEVNDEIFALDNRCPHEGYPLSQGSANGKACVLTCNWHNWKFDLKSGKCLVGGDNVRTYPVHVDGNEIKVDLSDPKPEVIRDQIVEDGLKEAFEKREYGRISREVARLSFNELDPLYAVKKSILWSYDKFEYGMTHAYAALADWLALYDESQDLTEKLICLTEGIEHIAFDSLRRPTYPFVKNSMNYSPEKLFEAVENEKAADAESLVQAGITEGMRFSDFEEIYSKIALEHYNDFGHSLIYVYKASQVAKILDDPEVDRALLLALIRSLCYTTREDLIPDFKRYSETLKKIEQKEFGTREMVEDDLSEKKITASYEWLENNLDIYTSKALYDFGLKWNALNLLRFDLKYQEATNNPVSQNVGWLAFTHALTFSNAVRVTCEKYPKLWRQGLVQMMSFYGRNSGYTDSTIKLDDWKVESLETLTKEVKEKIFDHGMAVPIFSAHLIKTATAVFEECQFSSEQTREALLAATNRFLKSPLKQKHVKRTVRQGINLVKKDFSS